MSGIDVSDRGKRVGLQQGLDLAFHVAALFQHGAQAGREVGDDQTCGVGACHDHGLLGQCGADFCGETFGHAWSVWLQQLDQAVVPGIL